MHHLYRFSNTNVVTINRMIRHSYVTEQRARDEQRRQDYARQERMHALDKDQLIKTNAVIENRIETKRYQRRVQEEDREREMDTRIKQAEVTRLLSEQQAAQEQQLAREMEKIKIESQRQERVRQQIRENSHEIRELEAKLKLGYLNRERAVQIAEKDVETYNLRVKEMETAQKLQEEWENAARIEEKELEKRKNEMIDYQGDLERQLEEQELKKKEAYEEFLREKLMIDEIIRKIYEEDEQALKARFEKQHATQNYIKEFLEQRESWRIREEEIMEEENRRILGFANKQQEREDIRQTEKRLQEEAKVGVQEHLTDFLYTKNAEKEEMDKIRNELYIEEQEEKERRGEKRSLEKQIRARLELQDAHHNYMELKSRKEGAMKEEEEVFKRQMMDKFAEDDRIEQMNAQKRRMKQQEHRRAVEALLQERRARFVKQKEREMEERMREEELEGMRKLVVEQERQRLLKEHATKLLGYLPKGVLRDQQDVENMGGKFKEDFENRRVNMFSDENF